MSRQVPSISLALDTPEFIGYRDAFFCTEISVTVQSSSQTDVAVEVSLRGECVAACALCGVVPAGKKLVLSAAAFSPVALADCDLLHATAIEAEAFVGGERAGSAVRTVTALPFDWWEGLTGNAAYVAAYVRPASERCAALLEAASRRLKSWGREGDARDLLAALYEEVRARRRPLGNLPDLSRPLSARKEDLFGTALTVCGCLERAGYPPVLALGGGIGVGVWRRQSCLLSATTDDARTVEQYKEGGDLCFFDAEDLTAPEAGFAVSERKSVRKYRRFVDIRRCRFEGISPCPVRKKGKMGYETVRTEEYDGSAPPPLLPPAVRRPPSGRETWEKKLFDFSGKNPLLSLPEKAVVEVAASEALLAARELRLYCGERPPRDFREVFALEAQNGMARIFETEETAEEKLARLYRRARADEEESGAETLCLAFGALSYPAREGTRRAPVALLPVRLERRGEGFVLFRAGNAVPNDTLFEFLKRERALDLARAEDPAALFAAVREGIAGKEGFSLQSAAYLGNFSFQRYDLWRDLHLHFDAFAEHPLVHALVTGEPLEAGPSSRPAGEILLPLSADGAQSRAIARAAAGESFVLHGPPGTGKSQTIANIIANALYRGKRVLFVAEKKAALDVVKARLDGVGAGEFCLELHAGKTEKESVLKRMEKTLALEPEPAPPLPSAELHALSSALQLPLDALHEKREAGFSACEAAERYFAVQGAPDLIGLSSSFFDGLTAQKLAECRKDLLAAAAAAKECGGEAHSPFAGVGLEEETPAAADALRCACEATVAEAAHLKRMLSLVAEAFCCRVPPLSRRTLDGLEELLSRLGTGDPFFAEESGFLALNRAYDGRRREYGGMFRAKARIPSAEKLAAYLGAGGDWKLSAEATEAVRKLQKVSRAPLAEEEAPHALFVALDLARLTKRLAEHPYARRFFRGGKIRERRREELLAPVYALARRAEDIFPEFRPETFSAGCARAAALQPLFRSFLRAKESFLAAAAHLCRVAHMEEGEDMGELAKKASALLENLDLLPGWCAYRATRRRLSEAGITLFADALEEGKLDLSKVAAAFDKQVCRGFLERCIPADPLLSRMTVGSSAEAAERLKEGVAAYAEASRKALRASLLSRRAGETSVFFKAAASGLRGKGLRTFFAEIPTLFRTLCPCLLMSPSTVAQYLPAIVGDFDLVIFDEASQLPTAEALGALARGKAAIVVGDPKQLPPTPFFGTLGEDESSVLDDCISVGMGEEKLLWHYRSRHESLIAFSNATYYGNRLYTIPSPDAPRSRVQWFFVGGVYDRARTKRNPAEADALVKEVLRRLSDPALSERSMGVVTFSVAQRDDIEKKLFFEIAKRGLGERAFRRKEPLFVKNLENVQGDERDVILFSVCYGRDREGKMSHNFGPLNQAGGWRRLNVAVSRAKEEMLVFSSVHAADIDLGHTHARGAEGLKAFLAYAEGGMGTVSSAGREDGVGKYLAAELEKCGYECRLGVGASSFRIDVAVVDPRDPGRFLAALLGDGGNFSAKEKYVLQEEELLARGWKVARVGTVRFFNNPKRETERIKAFLDSLTGKEAQSAMQKYRRPYRYAGRANAETPAFFESGRHDEEIRARLKAIVAAEEPIGRELLKRRCLACYGVEGNRRIGARLDELIDGCSFRRDRAMGTEYFYRTARAVTFCRYRVEGGTPVRHIEDLTVYEMLAVVKGALEDKVALYFDELVPAAADALKQPAGERFARHLGRCLAYGEEKGLFVRSSSDRITLA